MARRVLLIIITFVAIVSIESCSVWDGIVKNPTPTLKNSSEASPIAQTISDDEYETLRIWLLKDKGYLTAKWGEEDCNLWGSLEGCPDCGDCKHTGVDYGTSGKYEDVYAVADGEIVGSGGSTDKLCIYNKITDITFCYLHLSSFEKTSGEIKQGQLIGKSGKYGDSVHLHFEARKWKKSSAACCFTDTINPYEAARMSRKEEEKTTYRIAFVSNRDGNNEIYVMNADGSGVTNLTNNPADDSDPVWSPDGSRIAFRSDRDGNEEIYVMNADGSGVTNLTNNPSHDYNHVWSPDGTRIIFISALYPHNVINTGDIYAVNVMNADGSGMINLTNDSTISHYPVWSPDSSRIAFYSARDGNIEIYVMNADGSGVTRLTNNPKSDGEPSWSPDSSRIAFNSWRDGNGEIYVMNADGSGVTNLTNNPGEDCNLVWSPDGTRIAYNYVSIDMFRENEIYVMNADGSGVINLTNNPSSHFRPVWSPNSSRIAFESAREGNFEIYVVNADGSGMTNLTNHPGYDAAPVWSPDGSRIAFMARRDGNSEIYVVNADGSGMTNLTNHPGNDYVPVWSPVPLPPLIGSKVAPTTIPPSIAQETPTLVANSTPLDLLNPESIVYWLAYDMAHGQTDSFRKVLTEDTIEYGTGYAGGRNKIDKAMFLIELERRIVNKPTCEVYRVFDYDDGTKMILIGTRGWQPLWDVYVENIGVLTSDQIVFEIFMGYRRNGQIGVNAYFYPFISISLNDSSSMPCPTTVGSIPVPQPTTEPQKTEQTVKQYARISDQVAEVNLRRSSGYTNKDDLTDVIIKIPSGALVEIIGGPEEADGLQWWYISWNGYQGWIADHTGNGRVIIEFIP